MTEATLSDYQRPVPTELTYRWHKVIELIIQELKVPIAVITRREGHALTCFHTNTHAVRAPPSDGYTRRSEL